MLHHPLSKIQLLPLLLMALLLPALTLPTTSLAAADAAMKQSLNKFFDNGVVLRGAKAELIRVEKWPATTGSLRWSLPNIKRGHPFRISLIAEQGQKRWYVPVRVHWWAKAIVMLRAIPARTLLTPDMMSKKLTDIAGHSGHWWDNSKHLVGMRLTRPLGKGDIILSSYVKQPPLIKRGDIVQIVLDSGMIRIRAEGKALRTAQKGERLLVKNLRSDEIIQATAERTGVVRVILWGTQG